MLNRGSTILDFQVIDSKERGGRRFGLEPVQ